MEEAYYNAQKCTEFNETREMGKSLLKQIAHFRAMETTANNNGTSTSTASPGGNVSTSMADNDSIDQDAPTTTAAAADVAKDEPRTNGNEDNPRFLPS